MRKPSFILVAALTISYTWAGQPGPVAHSKVSEDLKNVSPSSSVDVIVQYNVQPTDAHFQRAHALGGTDKRKFTNIPHAAFTLPASSVQALASDPDVKFVSPDRKVKAHLAIAAPTIGANLVWQLGYTGTGIGVAVIDSGVAQDDQDLSSTLSSVFPFVVPQGATPPPGAFPAGNGSRIVYAEDFTQPLTSGDRYHAKDDYGHGTHVASIIAGNGTQSSGNNAIQTYKGIAPNANIISLRVLDQNGEGADSTVIAAIDQAIQLKNQYKIRVINLSLGRPVTESFENDPLCQAVEQAWKAGIVVVVAAGNDGRDNSFNNNGYGTINAPGNDPYVITVGAMKSAYTTTRIDDAVTTYSSRGPTPVDHIVKPDIMAPGNAIAAALQHGTLVQGNPQNFVSRLLYMSNAHPNDGSNYFILNGTSMATGAVSGAAADLLQAQPSLTPDQVKARLMSTASKSFNYFGTQYFSTAADVSVMQQNIAAGQFTLQNLQQTASQAQNQLNNDQNKLGQDTLKMQADAARVAADSQAVSNAQNAVPAAQAASSSAALAYSNALAAQTAAQTALTNAQAALQAAQQSYPGNSPQVQTAQANQQAAQTALQNAQNAANTAQNNANQAAQALQRAQNAVTQAQNQLANDQQPYQNDSSQVARDNATVASDTSALQSANAAVTQEQQQITAWNQELTTDQQTLAQEQASASQYSTNYDIFTIGAGYLDLNAAVTSTAVAPAGAPALSPVAYVDPISGQIMASGSYGTLCGNTALGGNSTSPLVGAAFCSDPQLSKATAFWLFSSSASNSGGSGNQGGTLAVWDARSVWGTTVSGGSADVSGTRSVWGANSVSGTQSVWGTRSVWGAQSVWGTSDAQAFQSIWSNQSVWGANSNGADAIDYGSSVLTSGDPD